MKRVKIIIITLSVICCVAGCNRKYYVDEGTIGSLYEEALKNKSEITADEGYDDEQSRYEADYASASANYIYFSDYDGSYIVDIKNNTYSNMCNIAGCSHTGKSCVDSMAKISIRYHKNGLYFLNGSSLYCRTNDGEINKVYTNDFSTEWSKKMNPENPEVLKGMIFIDENALLMSGINFFIKYDLTTGERIDELVLPDGYVMDFCYSDGIIFSSYYNGKLVRTVWDTGESETVAKLGTNVRLINDRIWYAKYSPIGSKICSNNIGFTDEKIEIENTEVMFDVFDDVVIYTEAYERYYLINKYGETRELFKIEDLTYSYDKLPPEYQYDNGETEFQPKMIYFLNYDNEDVYFEAKYWIDCDGITKDFSTFYKVDTDGNITELRNENEI